MKDEMRERAIEQICQKHFPQLKFYPELLPIIEEAYAAGERAGIERAAQWCDEDDCEAVAEMIRRRAR